MKADLYEPKIIKQMLLKSVVLEWTPFERRYYKKWMKKRKRPVVLSHAEICAQIRLKQVQRRLNKLRKKVDDLDREERELWQMLRTLADNAIDFHRNLPPYQTKMVARRRYVGALDFPGAYEQRNQDPLPPVEHVRLRQRIREIIDARVPIEEGFEDW